MRARIVAVTSDIIDAASPANPHRKVEGEWHVELIVTDIEEHVTKEVVLRAMSGGVEFLVVPQ